MTPYSETGGIIWLQTADSTNKEVRRRMGSLDNLSIIAALTQTAGRGQGTHTWYSRPGTGLTFSLLLRFPPEGEYALNIKDVLLITELTTVSLRDFLLGRGIEARIKWPNDIWVGDRKICGILIENVLDAEMVSSSIVGIGLNVNETSWPSELPNPVSMRQLTGKEYALDAELEELGRELAKKYALLGTAEGRAQLDSEFNRSMFRLP